MSNWNWLNEAQERYITANEQGYEHDAKLSIAAALIAQAEATQELIAHTKRLADAHETTWHYIVNRDGANAQRWRDAASDALIQMARRVRDTDAEHEHAGPDSDEEAQ